MSAEIIDLRERIDNAYLANVIIHGFLQTGGDLRERFSPSLLHEKNLKTWVDILCNAIDDETTIDEINENLKSHGVQEDALEYFKPALLRMLRNKQKIIDKVRLKINTQDMPRFMTTDYSEFTEMYEQGIALDPIYGEEKVGPITEQIAWEIHTALSKEKYNLNPDITPIEALRLEPIGTVIVWKETGSDVRHFGAINGDGWDPHLIAVEAIRVKTLGRSRDVEIIISNHTINKLSALRVATPEESNAF